MVHWNRCFSQRTKPPFMVGIFHGKLLVITRGYVLLLWWFYVAMKIPWVFPLEMIEKWWWSFFIEIAVSCDRKRLVILVGGIPSPLKNMKVSWDDEIPNIWKVIIQIYPVMFQSPPTSIHAWSKGIPHASCRCFSRCLGRTGEGSGDENFQPWFLFTVPWQKPWCYDLTMFTLQ